MVLTPNEPKKAVPPLLFSYFNPLKESYVTLKGDKLPVVVEGGAATAVDAGDRERFHGTTRAADRAPDRRTASSGYSLSADGSRRLGTDVCSGFHAARFFGPRRRFRFSA